MLLNELEDCIKMKRFWDERNAWAISTFGDINSRGPLGPLLHLIKEVQEAIKEIEKDPQNYRLSSDYLKELIDCKFLLEEAMMRSGMTYGQIAQIALDKLEENKKRKWPAPKGDNKPVEHLK